MSKFLESLANQLEQNFALGENTNRSLNDVVDGNVAPYAKLGDFSNKFDKTEERQYVEEGYLREDAFTVSAKPSKITWQEPEATVIIKKAMFSSVANNYRPDFMDQEERLFYRASKALFNNKCKQISAFEKLTKFEQAYEQVQEIDPIIVPYVIQLAETLNSDISKSPIDRLVVDRLQKAFAYNKNFRKTTWHADSTKMFSSPIDESTGVIELTNFTNLTTNTTVERGSGGNATFSLEDPYELMLITEHDIESAISDAANLFTNSKAFSFMFSKLEDLLNDNLKKLVELRKARGVSNIKFEVNPETVFGKRVIAIVERSGTEIPFEYSLFGGTSVSEEYFKDGSALGVEGLNTKSVNLSDINFIFTDSELSLFKEIVGQFFQKISNDFNSQSKIKTYNDQTNYIRRKMRFHFLGNNIISPMDAIHIFISSRTMTDNKVMSGIKDAFSGLSILQQLNNTITDLKSSFNNVFNPSANIDLEIEKSLTVGPNFPTAKWLNVRNTFLNERAGAHVFAGVVNDVSPSYQDGRFTVNVSCSDNTSYLEKGVINFNPGVDTFNGAFFDPLTPFKTKFDSSPFDKKTVKELLPENKALLSQKGIIKHKSGPDAGMPATEDNLNRDVFIQNGQQSRIFYAPDGLVYKWKEGIGTLVQFGNSTELNDPNLVGQPSITKEPFAGQDIMNVASLLVTGLPYNYATYVKGLREFSGGNTDPYSNKNFADSFFTSLNNDLKKRNSLWGNFIPFKNLTVNASEYNNMLSTTLSISQKTGDLDSITKEIVSLKAALKPSDNLKTPGIESSREKIEARIASLVEKQNQIKFEQLSGNQQNIAVIGSDVLFEPNEFLDQSSKTITDPQAKKILRKKSLMLTRRLAWQIRANEDKNLFIVDDSYDKDYDIWGFDKALAGSIGLYTNSYTSVKEKLNTVLSLLDLEMFCDTQGHLRIRPPQYNRIPSSIFYKMMDNKKYKGIQIFPNFLNDLYFNQIDLLAKRIEADELKIRYLGALLTPAVNNDDAKNDDDILSVIKTTGASQGQVVQNFSFISNPNGEILSTDKVIEEANPDRKEPKDTFDKIKNQTNVSGQLFTAQTRFNIVSKANSIPVVSSTKDTNTYIGKIGELIKIKTGQSPNIKDYMLSANDQLNIGYVDIFKVSQEIGRLLADRQKSINVMYQSIKNIVEFKTLDAKYDNNNNYLLFPAEEQNINIPEVLENLIEDESFDDLGVDSGKRFIISNDKIISYDFSYKQPEYTSVQVTGQLSEYLDNGLPEAFNNALPGGGGNSLVSAAAIDYDLWRMFGVVSTSNVSVPFLTNPETQCLPYAVSLLNKARKNIITGSVTIVGNEYMQPGEVVYLENRGLLFYVTSVSHGFTVGSNFTTRLSLSYGHAPGEYIPTTLDLMGKMIYINRDASNYINYRQDNSFNQTNLGVVLLDDRGSDSSFGMLTDDNASTSSFGPNNIKTIQNIIYTAAKVVNTSNSLNQKIKSKVELRVYYSNDYPENNTLSEFAGDIKSILLGTKNIIKSSENTAANQSFPKFDDPDSIQVVAINLSEDSRSASSLSWSTARELSEKISSKKQISSGANTKPKDPTSSKQIKKVQEALFGYIVDCWLITEYQSSN